MRSRREVGDARAIEREVRALADPRNREGMKRFGITGADLLGVSVTTLRKVARRYQPDHRLAHDLWATGTHELRILASMLDVAAEVTPARMDDWAADFDSWDLCDQVCLNLFDRTDHVVDRSYAWSARPEEFVRRAGVVLMATAAVHRPDLPDRTFIDFLPVLVDAMTDERNFVKKGVSWSFRQIGKRDDVLRASVLDAVEPFCDSTDRTRRWIARDVTKELRGTPARPR